MQKWPTELRPPLWRLLLAAVIGMSLPASAEQGAARLQELLYGEALYHSHQQDYLSAISRLQLAEEQGLLPISSDDSRLFLARMKLAYGLHLEAGFDFHALLGEDVPEESRNRAWYELARTYFHKGYNKAAAEAMEHIQGEVPTDIAGANQLLRATVLMSMDQNLEAARVLEEWQGGRELAAYAYYNRGIALVRAGKHLQAVPALERAVKMRGRDEEQTALKDKAQLSLGYIFARNEDYRRARRHLEDVRPDGPFSNRALLALGWIAHQQGHSEAALVSWMELRGRSPTDPAVLESLLVVPAIQLQLDELQTASRDYEAAMAAYTSELNQLHDARESVQKGEAVTLLLQNGGATTDSASGRGNLDKTRFFGPLLASKNFQEMLQGHGELQSMLDTIDKGLQDVDAMAKVASVARERRVAAKTPSSAPRAGGEPTQSRAGSAAELAGRPNEFARTGEPKRGPQWAYRDGKSAGDTEPGIPQLPEIELPPERALKPLPTSEFIGLPESDSSGLPPAPEYIIEPPNAEITGLPETEIIWLPDSVWLRRPGEAEEEDYAYPDRAPARPSSPGERIAYLLNQLEATPKEETAFNAGAVPVGEALRDLAITLNNATQRMAQLGESYAQATGLSDPEERIAALRSRIFQLRERIANAIALHEQYTQAMALEELDRRQQLLQGLLEQASLELAKSYDQSSAH